MIPLDQASPLVGMAGITRGIKRSVAQAAGHSTCPEPRRAPDLRQGVAPVFAADRQRDNRDASGHNLAEEQGDGHCHHNTGHDKLPHFRPAEFIPRDLLPALTRLGVPAGLVLVGDGVPVCPRYIPAVRYVRLSLAVLLC
jgi:hypothetical protein